MQLDLRKTGRRLFVGLCVIVTTVGSSGAVAQVSPDGAAQSRRAESLPRTARPSAQRPAKASDSYFVEFRARHALSYGHTFLVHGRLNAAGEIGSFTAEQVAGLHPAGDSPVPWMIGHVAPVVSETGPSDGDLEEQYVSARYRIKMSKAEYDKVSSYIRRLQASSPVWHAVVYNCNSFVADVARSMGLRTPGTTLLYPADFITNLRDINSERPESTASASAEFSQ